MFKLMQGFSAETSGGLLICLPREQAAAYCKVIWFYFEIFKLDTFSVSKYDFIPIGKLNLSDVKKNYSTLLQYVQT